MRTKRSHSTAGALARSCSPAGHKANPCSHDPAAHGSGRGGTAPGGAPAQRRCGNPVSMAPAAGHAQICTGRLGCHPCPGRLTNKNALLELSAWQLAFPMCHSRRGAEQNTPGADFTDKHQMSRLWCFHAGMRSGLAGQAAFRTMEGRMHCSAGAVARAQRPPPQRPHQSSHRAAKACARAAVPRSAGSAVACCPADSELLAGSARTRCVPAQPPMHYLGDGHTQNKQDNVEL